MTLELDHHVDLAGLVFRDIAQSHFGGDQRCFCQSHAVIVVKHIPLELVEIFVDVRAVIVVAHTLVDGKHMIVWKPLFFGDVGDHIFPETVHTHVEPKPQDLLHFFPHQGVVHIEVRLFHRKQVQVIFSTHLVPGPGLALKVAVPVVGKLSVRFTGPPDIIIGVGIDPLPALLEPFVLVAGVVYNQVHNHLHIPLMGAIQNRFECFHAAEFRCDVHIIGNVIAAVSAGGGVEGRKPDAVATQGFDVIQFIQYAPQIAHTVPVSILKTSGPDLIKYPVFVPFCVLHGATSCLFSL